MDLPVAVQQALGESAAGVSLRDASQANAHQLLRMVLLTDGQENLQVICRKEDLIDLEQLNKELHRDYRLMKSRDQLRVRERAGLKALPALPSLTGWPTVIDDKVDRLESVALELGEQNLAMVMPAADFQSLTHKAARRSFAVDVSSIAVNLNEPGKDRDQLHSAIKKFTGLRIQQRLDDTLELPPLPETAQRIIHLRVNPNAVMGDLVDIVESDPSLAAQVVSWASSSFYAAAGQVKSVHDAVSRVLGFDLVMNLAMGLSLGRALKHPKDHPDGYVDYWQQAIWQAQSAGVLASMMPRDRRPLFGLAYLAGLLHNFGYLLLAQVFPPHFKLVCRSLEVNPDIDSSVTEHYLLGITREQMAAQLMENWGMPDEVTLAIRYQKNPGYDGPHNVYARLLWLGRQLLTQRGVALGAGQVVGDDVYDGLGLDRTRVEAQFDELVESKDSIMAMAGMMGQ
ncbi:HDOD domain-containing protein [Marinobacter lutaoensis]|jgi:HD-like signal output (HDOD) protein/prolyl-tRNA editing enzyme YbaK/EbsC (Cys-tRNA(Pro) deacylase)|uniref:Signal transduction protein n=1 Tax=Marinobacter lutaoensis TaxID=135739 RepID=A0A1V2DNX8_9GAMM|nr:HDOD domain-containing protein [Marinobacter lutaoensis]NVD36048.1 HDOD domain-containing protein [Marinobacter lutaoensis]ONF42333.1 signal transduction protein [Marinobacter lutaoensis]